MKKMVLAHDVGTSSVKTALVSESGDMLAQHTTAYDFQNPSPGWFEQNPMDYWDGVIENTRAILDETSLEESRIGGIVFSTQAMGIIPVDETGTVLHPNITWVDGRAEKQAQQLMNLLGGRTIFKKIVGVEITGKDVIPKIRWIRQNHPDLYQKTKYFLDVNGFLKFMATGQPVFEWSGACSYGFNLKKKDWERTLFKAAGVDLKKLPPLVRSTDLVGTLTSKAAAQLGLPENVAVYGGCDDTQSAAMGSGAIGEGQAHIYLGTSAWVGVTTARNLKHKNGAFCLQSADPDMNLLVGITESAGANLDWLINNFYKLERADPKISNIYDFIAAETNGIPDGSDHLVFTPWLMGERCPVSTTTTRGTIFNLSLEHERGHLVKALLEGIGYNLRWILDNFERDFGFSPSVIRAIGGGSVNEQWIQGIANITGKSVQTVANPRMSGAFGAAACAFVGNGTYQNFSEAAAKVKGSALLAPDLSKKAIFDQLFQDYQNIYSSLVKTYQTANLKRFNS